MRKNGQVGRAIYGYAETGWPVFPLHIPDQAGHCSCQHPQYPNPGKHPKTTIGMNSATTEGNVIAEGCGSAPYPDRVERAGPESPLF